MIRYLTCQSHCFNLYTVNVHVQAASIEKPHPEFRSTDFGKKCSTIKFEVPVTFYCYKPTRTNNQGFTIKLKYEQVLSSQALNVGRSLGQGIMTTSIKMFGNPQKVKKFMQNRSLIMQSTNLPRRWSRTTKQSAIYLASTCKFYRTWRKDMRGSDWPKTSLQTVVRKNGDSF